MKILITGGNGFIAKNLYEQLKDTYTIYNPNKQELDLLDESNLKKYLMHHRFDVIIHTANYDAITKGHTKDPNLILENNLRMFFNLEQFDAFYGKLINLGSGAEYGRENWTSCMKETYANIHLPSDPYGLSKNIISKYIQKSKKMYNLRLFSVYGKYENYSARFISNAICRTLFDMPIIINNNVFYDFCYIDDVVKIIDWFINNSPRYHVFNVCTTDPYDLIYLAKLIGGDNYPRIYNAQPYFTSYTGLNNRLLNAIGPYTFTSIEDGIHKLKEHYIQNINSIDKKLL